MQWLLGVNALMFIFLHVIWSKSSLLNILVKTALLVLALFNGFEAYQLLK